CVRAEVPKWRASNNPPQRKPEQHPPRLKELLRGRTSMLRGYMDVPEKTLQRVGGEDRTRAGGVVHQIDRLRPGSHSVHVGEAEERQLPLGQWRTLLDGAP